MSTDFAKVEICHCENCGDDHLKLTENVAHRWFAGVDKGTQVSLSRILNDTDILLGNDTGELLTVAQLKAWIGRGKGS